jgi:hypothetical protein
MNWSQFFVPTAAGAAVSVNEALLLGLTSVGRAFAQDGQEPLGGQSPKGGTASIEDFDLESVAS